jgi:3-methyl-2-oxobutanoate hydroxymethyltransferase
MAGKLVEEAKALERAGAAMIDFTSSGPIAGPAVAKAVSIPVLGGLGGGPWLDGRMRMAHAAIGYAANAIDNKPDTYANVAQVTLDALAAFANDVRSARQIKGGIPVKPA